MRPDCRRRETGRLYRETEKKADGRQPNGQRDCRYSRKVFHLQVLLFITQRVLILHRWLYRGKWLSFALEGVVRSLIGRRRHMIMLYLGRIEVCGQPL
jgi:hypothetical protein